MSHLDAIEHAAAVDAVRDAADKRLIDNERVIGEQIDEVLTKTVRNIDYRNLSLPRADWTHNKVGIVSLFDVVTDQVSFGKPAQALMTVIAHSECPMVAQLRQVIADSYKDANLSDIAEVSL